jgi:hypothetical protein
MAKVHVHIDLAAHENENGHVDAATNISGKGIDIVRLLVVAGIRNPKFESYMRLAVGTIQNMKKKAKHSQSTKALVRKIEGKHGKTK